MNVPASVLQCPVHGIPDCSPMLNGCSIPSRLANAYQQGRADLAAKVEALLDAACHHCGSAPDTDGDHSCPCPRSDDDCTEHAVRPVMPDGLRAVLAADSAPREDQP